MDRTTAILIGDADIRGQTRAALEAACGVEIVGELTAYEERHARFLAALAPEIVILDMAAAGLDPVRVLTNLRELPARPRVIAVAPDGAKSTWIARELGATAVVETAHALRQAVRREPLQLLLTHDIDRAA
jgi:DNA-binding NarL/FixJ family response regulator